MRRRQDACVAGKGKAPQSPTYNSVLEILEAFDRDDSGDFL